MEHKGKFYSHQGKIEINHSLVTMISILFGVFFILVYIIVLSVLLNESGRSLRIDSHTIWYPVIFILSVFIMIPFHELLHGLVAKMRDLNYEFGIERRYKFIPIPIFYFQGYLSRADVVLVSLTPLFTISTILLPPIIYFSVINELTWFILLLLLLFINITGSMGDVYLSLKIGSYHRDTIFENPRDKTHDSFVWIPIDESRVEMKRFRKAKQKQETN